MRTCTAGLASLVLAMAMPATEGAAQERADEDPAVGCYALEVGAWDTERVTSHAVPDKLFLSGVSPWEGQPAEI